MLIKKFGVFLKKIIEIGCKSYSYNFIITSNNYYEFIMKKKNRDRKSVTPKYNLKFLLRDKSFFIDN